MALFEKIQNRRSIWSDVTSSSSRSSALIDETKGVEKEPAPYPPPRLRRTTGWSDETGKSSKDSFKSAERLTIIDSDDDVPVIPDLEEIQDDYSKNVVCGTSVAVIQVSKYKETDTDILKHSTFSAYEDGILRLLTKGMNSEAEVKEDGAPMTLQQLFTEVSSSGSTS